MVKEILVSVLKLMPVALNDEYFDQEFAEGDDTVDLSLFDNRDNYLTMSVNLSTENDVNTLFFDLKVLSVMNGEVVEANLSDYANIKQLPSVNISTEAANILTLRHPFNDKAKIAFKKEQINAAIFTDITQVLLNIAISLTKYRLSYDAAFPIKYRLFNSLERAKNAMKQNTVEIINSIS